jgi:tetratricopeptide (TPR) repeat protein
VLDDQPENGEALYLAALVHERMGEQDKALDFAKRATQALPRFGAPWAILASVYKAKGDHGSALKAALQATACDDRDPGLWMLLGDVQVAAGQKPAAVQSFRKAMDRKPPPLMKEKLEARLKEYK